MGAASPAALLGAAFFLAWAIGHISYILFNKWSDCPQGSYKMLLDNNIHSNETIGNNTVTDNGPSNIFVCAKNGQVLTNNRGQLIYPQDKDTDPYKWRDQNRSDLFSMIYEPMVLLSILPIALVGILYLNLRAHHYLQDRKYLNVDKKINEEMKNTLDQKSLKDIFEKFRFLIPIILNKLPSDENV